MSDDVEQAGPQVEVDGDPAGGYIVQVHDGEMAHVFTLMADSAEAAEAKALKQWAEATKGDDGASGAA
jgi:hypothetical protein